MTTFYPSPKRLPKRLETADFTITPLLPAHVGLDHAALMDSIQLLRSWSGSPWPMDDFSIEDNMKDMHWHSEEHEERIAFTFTVLNPAEAYCLGCIYIKPIVEALEENPKLPVQQDGALVRFWIRDLPELQSLNGRLLQTLQQWFMNEWDFTTVYYHCRAEHTVQVEQFKAGGLKEVAPFTMPTRGGQHILFK
ncbi:MAG: hypothetical protein AAF490_01230 [Chloroflexota bacterium]